MKRIDVGKHNGEWQGKSGGKTVTSAPTKEEAVRKTAKLAKSDPQPVSVRIHKANGRLQEERTYPRKADPPKSKG